MTIWKLEGGVQRVLSMRKPSCACAADTCPAPARGRGGGGSGRSSGLATARCDDQLIDRSMQRASMRFQKGRRPRSSARDQGALQGKYLLCWLAGRTVDVQNSERRPGYPGIRFTASSQLLLRRRSPCQQRRRPKPAFSSCQSHFAHFFLHLVNFEP